MKVATSSLAMMTFLFGSSTISTTAAFTRSTACGVAMSKTLPRWFHQQANSRSKGANKIQMMAFSSTTSDYIKSEIASNDIMVFSKSYCPYCTKTKELFQSLGLEYCALELDNVENGVDIQAALLDMTGQRTVPNVFIKGTHLGGNDDTQSAAKTGRLDQLLKENK